MFYFILMSNGRMIIDCCQGYRRRVWRRHLRLSRYLPGRTEESHQSDHFTIICTPFFVLVYSNWLRSNDCPILMGDLEVPWWRWDRQCN